MSGLTKGLLGSPFKRTSKYLNHPVFNRFVHKINVKDVTDILSVVSCSGFTLLYTFQQHYFDRSDRSRLEILK